MGKPGKGLSAVQRLYFWFHDLPWQGRAQWSLHFCLATAVTPSGQQARQRDGFVAQVIGLRGFTVW